MLVLNSPERYLERLGPLPEDVELTEDAGGTFNWAQCFVRDVSELRRLGAITRYATEYDAILWISYPKKSSKIATDISRERAWEVMEGFGLRPVSQVSVDETWSALRFRPPERVGK